MTEVSQFLIDRLQVVLEGEIRQLDPQLPTILVAHVMVDTATYGAERFWRLEKVLQFHCRC